MADENKPEDDDENIGFGDKFARHIIGSIAGFFMTLVAEYFYTRWIIRHGDDKDENEEN